MSKYKSKVPPPKVKTAAETAAEYVIFLIVSIVLYYTIICFFKFLFAPARYLLMSSDEIDQEDIKKAKEKIKNRNSKREEWKSDESDPLNWYIKYGNEETGEDYEVAKKWYDSWTKGEILDTQMRWAPEVYHGEGGSRCVSKAFIDYLDNQIKIHRAAGILRWVGFAHTLKTYYPEVRLGHIDYDLKELKERARVGDLTNKLIKEITSEGLSEEIARELIALDVPGDRLYEIVSNVNYFHQNDMSDTWLKFYIRHYALHDSTPTIHDPNHMRFLDKALYNGVPEDIALELTHKVITVEEFIEIVNECEEFKEIWGMDAFRFSATYGDIRVYGHLREFAEELKSKRNNNLRNSVLDSYGE